MTRFYAEVIGDPIDHSKSPVIHGFWLEKVGMDADYVATRVRAEELGDYFRSRLQDPYWRGCNVTVPHKLAVIPYVQDITPLAAEVGAANVVVPDAGQLHGGNSDVEGIAKPVSALGRGDLHEACLIGSGGAALAALAAFRLLGISRVTLNVRNREKGQELLRRWGFDGRVGEIDDRRNLSAAQLVVNATTLGMQRQAAMPEAVLRAVAAHPEKQAIVFDMVYAPLETELLKAARQGGLRTIDGLSMLVGQAAGAFQGFFGMHAPREHDAELRALLTS